MILIISPYEANALVPLMLRGGKATLHIYSPRANPAFHSLDNLELFPFPRRQDISIPEKLTVSLNLLAGQLDFNDYAAYVAACKFLGLS